VRSQNESKGKEEKRKKTAGLWGSATKHSSWILSKKRGKFKMNLKRGERKPRNSSKRVTGNFMRVLGDKTDRSRRVVDVMLKLKQVGDSMRGGIKGAISWGRGESRSRGSPNLAECGRKRARSPSKKGRPEKCCTSTTWGAASDSKKIKKPEGKGPCPEAPLAAKGKNHAGTPLGFGGVETGQSITSGRGKRHRRGHSDTRTQTGRWGIKGVKSL